MISILRQMALMRQGLGAQPCFGAGLAGVHQAIGHLGYVQIDTISVVERAHHHILWSRVPAYDPADLNRLVKQQDIFEYWYHAASYLPMRDYRYALPRMAAIRNGENRYYTNGDRQVMAEIIVRIRDRGPTRLRDAGGRKSGNGWWNAGPVRRAADILFMQGDLMICERNGMEKIYDLSERCLPAHVDMRMPTVQEYAAYLFDTTLRAHGVFTFGQLVHLRAGKPLRDAMRQIVDDHLDAGTIMAWQNADGVTLYADVQGPENLSSAKPFVKILSPFDNTVIHRERLCALFGFEYRIECYTPPAKRVFGYFCLPVLYGDKIVGQIDCKAHRGKQRLEVLALHVTDRQPDRFYAALHKELQNFAAFNKCTMVDTGAMSDALSC